MRIYPPWDKADNTQAEKIHKRRSSKRYLGSWGNHINLEQADL